MTSVMEWSAQSLPTNLLVLAPHPDDDVLGCSLLMRRVAAQGGRITIAWLTDGGSSHGELTPDQRRALVASRRSEALAGVGSLGVLPEATYFLGYPDGALSDRIDEGRRRCQTLCERHVIDTVVVTDGGDDHPDHRAAFLIAGKLTAPRVYSYPISARYDGKPYSPPVGSVCIVGEAGHFKRAALGLHQSQTDVGGAIYPLSASTVDRFCADPEYFIPVRT